MDRPNKCKNCQWYGKPYWSIINPCDNCPMENVETFTSFVDPTIGQLKEENERLNNILDGIENNMLSIIYKNIPVIYKEYDLLNQDVKKYFKELKGEDKEWK